MNLTHFVFENKYRMQFESPIANFEPMFNVKYCFSATDFSNFVNLSHFVLVPNQ